MIPTHENTSTNDDFYIVQPSAPSGTVEATVVPGLLPIQMPVYNEEESLGTIVDRALNAVPPHGLDREIIIVDDGSTDGSAAVAEVSTVEPRRFVWTPAWMALALTLGLRVFYSALAALLAPGLRLDLRLIRSNGWTDGLMSRAEHPVLYALLGIWERFDTLWYLHIAAYGYDRPDGIVFYPLYPILIHAVSWITGSELAAAVVVSTVATFFMLWGAMRLFEQDLDRVTSFRAVVIWMAMPGAFTFFAGYPDSLVVALIVWSIYFARSGQWRWAGALGFFAGLTKALGCFVALPLIWIGWRGRERRSVAAAVACIAGVGAFQVWLGANHFPPVTAVYQKYWGTSTVAPWVTIRDVFWSLTQRIDLLLILNCIALVGIAAAFFSRRVRLEYQIFAVALIGLFLTKHTNPLLQSTMRYSLCVFPAFSALASRCDRGARFGRLTVVLFGLNLCVFRMFLDWNLVV
jgi:hypothetical protein